MCFEPRTLVRAARAANDQKAVAGYIEETLQYADGLFCNVGKTEVIRLSMRVAQILRLEWETEAADAWYPAGVRRQLLSYERRDSARAISFWNCLVDH